MKTNKEREAIPYQFVIRSANRINYANTWANDFQIYLPEFLPNDCNRFKVKLIQCVIPKIALPADTSSGNRLRANFIEINVFFNSAYGFDTLYQGCNRYTCFLNCANEIEGAFICLDMPTMVVNKFDMNLVKVQVFGHYPINPGYAGSTDMTRSLLIYQDGNITQLRTCNLIFEITPIYNDVDEY